MKKILLLLLVGTLSQVNAQVLQSDDFNTLTVGDVGTDITGATDGQGGWYTATSNGVAPTTSINAGNSNFQIVADGDEGTNGFKLVSPDGNKGSRFMWKDGLGAAWDTRDLGNDIIEVEFNLYTGAETTSTVQAGVRLYGIDDSVTPAANRTLNGFVYTMNTRVLSGVAYLNNAGTFGTYLITLQTGGLILDPDTWYRIGFAYDSNTGETIWKTSAVYTGLPDTNWAGPFIVDEVDFVSIAPTTNAAESEVIFDAYSVEATPEEALLNVTEVVTEANFSVYPNPAKNVINISNTMNVTVNDVVLTDLNGRVVKSQKVNAIEVQVNVADLATGIYMMNVTTDQGNITKKIIKE